MKKFWVKAIPFNKEIITTALESGAEAVVIPEGQAEEVKALGIIKTIAKDGDLKLGEDVVEVEITNKEDENKAVELGKSKTVIVRTTDWMVIPLENLIAQTKSLFAEVKTAEEAKTVLGVLEKGVDGIVLNTTDLNEIKKTSELINQSLEILALEVAKITELRNLAMGDRVCVDTCTQMGIGQGMLVGNSSEAMFLVHSESVQTPYVAERPFRVNAGAVHAYTLVGGGRTKYLAELSSGDEVVIVDYTGKTQTAIVGRSKIERRPLMLVKAESKGRVVSLILQNAETIRLVKPDGKPISIVGLKPDYEVLAYFTESGLPAEASTKAGRHFGMPIQETLTEK